MNATHFVYSVRTFSTFWFQNRWTHQNRNKDLTTWGVGPFEEHVNIIISKVGKKYVISMNSQNQPCLDSSNKNFPRKSKILIKSDSPMHSFISSTKIAQLNLLSRFLIVYTSLESWQLSPPHQDHFCMSLNWRAPTVCQISCHASGLSWCLNQCWRRHLLSLPVIRDLLNSILLWKCTVLHLFTLV